MKKFLVLFCVLICSCARIKYDDINPEIRPNKSLLPAMEPLVDKDALFSAYGRSGNVGLGHRTSSGSRGNISSSSSLNIRTKDDRMNDVVGIFNKEVKENITNPYGKKNGYILLKLGKVEYNKNYLFPILSGATLFTINLFGYPANNVEQTMEVEVVILNKQKEKIKSYTETVSDMEYRAVWWGYETVEEIARKANATNIKTALERIRLKIDNDADEIIKQLD